MTRRKDRSPPFVRPYLEALEDRVLLNASSGEQAAFAFVGDVFHLGGDMETSPLALINAPPPNQHDAARRAGKLVGQDTPRLDHRLEPDLEGLRAA